MLDVGCWNSSALGQLNVTPLALRERISSNRSFFAAIMSDPAAIRKQLKIKSSATQRSVPRRSAQFCTMINHWITDQRYF
jgi:hypothetical protein